ncbi:MAG: nitrogen fixation protein NifQ [Candidatus Accumulibacter sp.]|nr:nitrogen fixation protein NifQ [Accumulibacter sp.]MCB1964670.1 nitrogen fixation protein NifQ [Accumulibacter sp.]
MNAPDRLLWRATLLADLLARPAPATALRDPNRFLLARIIAGQIGDAGCLPADLGLGGPGYRRMVAEYFPGFEAAMIVRTLEVIPEWRDLQKLLLEYRADERHSELWLADIVATACAGRDHLWQDLGLRDRDELTSLMWVNFPELARTNSGDMKWKKFLYRHFCTREGIYACPAPSCGECDDYGKCFGPES